MSLTLGEVITAARDRHPAFFRTRVTDAVLARYLSDYQNELLDKAVIRDRQYLAQTLTIAIAPSTSINGAGTGDGAPGTVTNGAFTIASAPTGSAIEAAVAASDGATVWMSDTVVTSATSTTTTAAGASRTASADIGRTIVVTTGTGAGQRRLVTANTTTTWAHAAWDTTPDTSSMIAIVSPVLVTDETAGAVTNLPSTTTALSYLVKRDSSGVPYIDYTTPLRATVEQGVPLPSVRAVLPDLCQAWTNDAVSSGGLPVPLVFTTAQRRFDAGRWPAVYLVGSTLYLCGTAAQWTGIASLEIRYVPVAPVFTALTDLFLLPDAARPALVAQAAAFMALRVADMPDVQITPAPFAALGESSEVHYLRSVTSAKRGRRARGNGVW